MDNGLAQLAVLLVDDYDSIRNKMAEDLRKLGLKVTTASNGLQAMGLLRDQAFDLLITDLVMPEMDGFELCEEVRKTPATQDLPVIVTSTHCDSLYIMKALRLGADDYISKPIELDLLARIIRRVRVPTLTADGQPAAAASEA